MAFRSISFLTDYGLDDAYVAICRGVLLDLAPTAPVVDITHLVPGQDVRRGSTVLAFAAPHLAPSVFVAVVDPGVGGDRRGVAVAAGGSVLVGPDNGLLPAAADALGGVTAAVQLDRPGLHRQPVSATFHGRDVFCPVAARLFTGLPLAEAGTPVDPTSLVRLPDPVVRHGDGWLEAEVLQVDRYGNVQLATGAGDLARLGAPGGQLAVGEASAVLGRQFGSVPTGELVVYADSDGRVAVAVNRGRADQLLDVRAGDVVRLRRSGSPG